MHVVIRMARYRYAAFLGRVFILTMTAFGSDSLPTIPLDHGNKLPNLHNHEGLWRPRRRSSDSNRSEGLEHHRRRDDAGK